MDPHAGPVFLLLKEDAMSTPSRRQQLLEAMRYARYRTLMRAQTYKFPCRDLASLVAEASDVDDKVLSQALRVLNTEASEVLDPATERPECAECIAPVVRESVRRRGAPDLLVAEAAAALTSLRAFDAASEEFVIVELLREDRGLGIAQYAAKYLLAIPNYDSRRVFRCLELATGIAWKDRRNEPLLAPVVALGLGRDEEDTIASTLLKGGYRERTFLLHVLAEVASRSKAAEGLLLQRVIAVELEDRRLALRGLRQRSALSDHAREVLVGVAAKDPDEYVRSMATTVLTREAPNAERR
jgi:hypothetical protein